MKQNDENENSKSCDSDIPCNVAEKLSEIINNNTSLWVMVASAYELGRANASGG
jgi:PIN domain nuclease of toxin-antitoxin system